MALDEITPQSWAGLALLLDDAERARAERFRFERDRHAYIAAHALARTMLSAQSTVPPSDWRFSTNAYGKPEILREAGVLPLQFNLSHTRGLVAVALTLEHDVGIDVESVDAKRFSLDLAERSFAPKEVDLLHAIPASDLPEALFAIWTLKEACIKAMGRGLSVPLDAFALTLDPLAVDFSASLGENPARWMLRRMAPTRTHVLALALRHPDPATVRIDASGIAAAGLLALAGQIASGLGQMRRR